MATSTSNTMNTINTAMTTVSATKRRSLVPTSWERTVRVLELSECKEAAVSLAHAFAADEYARYLCDCDDDKDLDPEHKWRLHVDMMHYLCVAHCYEGIVTTIGPDHDSVALWLPPGKKVGWLTTWRSGLWKLYFQLSGEGWSRYSEVLPLLHNTKAAVLGKDRHEEAYYLVYLGTRPHARERGYARKLLEHMLQKADAENRLVYLESSALSNNNYYAKFGFEVRKEIFLKKAPVRLSIMVREPRQALEK